MCTTSTVCVGQKRELEVEMVAKLGRMVRGRERESSAHPDNFHNSNQAHPGRKEEEEKSCVGTGTRPDISIVNVAATN